MNHTVKDRYLIQVYIPKNSTSILHAIGVLSSVLIVFALREYLSSQWFTLALGCLAMPFVLHIRKNEKGSMRFGIVALLFILLSFIAPVSTFIYFAWIALIFFIIEQQIGKINLLAVVVPILASPIFSYLGNVFSFPVRIFLTSVCGKIFLSAGLPVDIAGNTITFGNDNFTVDPECMGLSMLSASFIMGILILGYYRKKYNHTLKIMPLLAYSAGLFVLNIIANMTRMFVLVLFRLLPGTAMHDIVGVICFIVQIILPAWGICWFIMRKKMNKPETQDTGTKYSKSVKKDWSAFVPLFISTLLWISIIGVNSTKESGRTHQTTIEKFAGYKTSAHTSGILKLENDNALVYIKKIRWFCDADHNPMICWAGSGYAMTRTQETIFDGFTIYTGILQKENNILYTAWWYSNGQSSTNSQFHWRWDMFKGNPAYSLINVTTSTEHQLRQEIERLRLL